MSQSRLYKWMGLLFIFSFVFFSGVHAQTIVITGTVKDSASSAPLPNVSVYIKGSRGTRTDSAGNFYLPLTKATAYIEFSAVGYKTLRRSLNSNPAQTINVSLLATVNELAAATVTNKKIKYSNKNNPAVELIRHVIENKQSNRMGAYKFAFSNGTRKYCFPSIKYHQRSRTIRSSRNLTLFLITAIPQNLMAGR